MKPFRHLNLFPPTLLLALSALLSRVMGVVRDHLLASSFGATAGTGIYDLDTYYAAFRIPDMIYNLLVLGAVSAAFIPIFTQYRKAKDMENAWAFASSLLHLMFAGVFVLALGVYGAAPWMAKWLAGGFTADQVAQTARLMRILLLSPILFSVTSVLISIQDSFKSFFFRSLGPLFYNLGIILGIVWFGERFGVVGVVWGVVLGALMNLLIQLPSLRLVRFRHHWIWGWRRADVRQALGLMIPRVVGLAVNQIALVVLVFIASFLVTGSITIFFLADNLQAVPIGIIGISFAITSFATFSELATERDLGPFAKELKRVLGQVFFLILPASVGMFVLRQPIVDLILLAGRFTAGDAALTATVLGFLAVSLFAQSTIPTLARGFYAFHNTRTPVISGVAGALTMIAGSYLLGVRGGYGVGGIAIAYSAGNLLNFALLYALMRHHLQLDILPWKALVKMVLISIVMGLLVCVTTRLLPFEGGVWERAGLLAFYIFVGGAGYFSLAFAVRLKQARMLFRQRAPQPPPADEKVPL